MTDRSFHFLNRVTYGPKREDVRYLKKVGWEHYVDEQLNPGAEPEALQTLISEKEYGWRFDHSGVETQKFSKLESYNLSIAKLFERCVGLIGPPRKYELRRVFYDTLIISWLKAIHSPWQLRELMVEFWHNHFTVSADIEDGIAGCMGAYDRVAIRPHAFGNFRTMLEEVTKSPAMLHYLDNAESRASPANENFARELFELHTMGAENYYNHLYDDWKKVPGALDGLADGYIDEDVYEAARAFSGWTVAFSRPDKQLPVPNTGEFYYHDRWHDPYKKRVLGVEIKSHQGPMEDGLQVLDLAAYHPRTAEFVCKKICRWLVADEPPKAIVEKAVKTWMKHLRSPDQIKETLRTILLAPEFEAHLGQKLKRPNHLVFAFVRMTGAELTPHESVFWWFRNMGYHQFTCPFPTGNPDNAEFWLNSDAMLKRWQSFPELERVGVAEDFFEWNILEEGPKKLKSFDQLLDYWSLRLLDGPVPSLIRTELREIFFRDLAYDTLSKLRASDKDALAFRTKQMVRLMCMSPEFQKR